MVKVLIAVLLVWGCGGYYVPRDPTPARTDAAAPSLESSRPVTGWVIWSNRGQVPARYRHTIDWHSWTGSVLAVFSYERVCTFVNDVGSPHPTRGELLTCVWYAPKGL